MSCEDVRELVKPALRHRLILNFEGEAEDIRPDDILDAVLVNMAQGGRIALCGGISAYNEKELPPGPRNYMQLVIRRCTMQGFLLLDYFSRAREAIDDLSRWIASGELVHAEDIQEGFENTPKTFQRLFQGKNLGKQLLKLGDPG